MPKSGYRAPVAQLVEQRTFKPTPDVLAVEIIEDLEAALAQFAGIAEELGEK